MAPWGAIADFQLHADPFGVGGHCCGYYEPIKETRTPQDAPVCRMRRVQQPFGVSHQPALPDRPRPGSMTTEFELDR